MDAPVVVVVVEELLTGVISVILEVVIHLTTINRFFIPKPEFFSVMNMNFGYKKWGCPKSRIAPFAIVYFGKKYYLTVAKNKHYSNG